VLCASIPKAAFFGGHPGRTRTTPTLLNTVASSATVVSVACTGPAQPVHPLFNLTAWLKVSSSPPKSGNPRGFEWE
jgi:hypothetical protein